MFRLFLDGRRVVSFRVGCVIVRACVVFVRRVSVVGGGIGIYRCVLGCDVVGVVTATEALEAEDFQALSARMYVYTMWYNSSHLGV